ncbi:5645_t:CDS:1, partial [Racocetra persica]
FYKLNEANSWTYAEVVEYYHTKLEQKDWMRVLDKIKKDLQIVASSDLSFDKKCKRKAQSILDC